MKTSNIIVVAFITCVLAGMLILFTAAKNHKEGRPKNYMANAAKEITKLAPFSVIVGQPGSAFHIEQATEDQIQVQYFDKKYLNRNAYRLSNDTLYFSGIDKQDTISYRIFCKKTNTVIGKSKSTVFIDSYISEQLNVSTDSGTLYLSNEKLSAEKYKNKVCNISITAVNNGYAQVHKSLVSHLNVILIRSNLNVYESTVHDLKADLKRKSKLNSYNNPENMQISKDHSSTFSINQ